jgi:hypothetical protein
MDETNIIVFRRGGIVRKNEKCVLEGNKIELVSYYKYIGIIFSSFLSWPLATKTLSNQGTKAVNILSTYRNKCNDLPVKIASI